MAARRFSFTRIDIAKHYGSDSAASHFTPTRARVAHWSIKIMTIPANVKEHTIPPGSVAQPRPDRINNERSSGSEVPQDAYKSNLSKPAPK
jgi:hypothetical protein